MRCTNCDYPLWSIPARACPECGQSFRPSELEFRPNAVRFCCPHCDQPYYGTDGHGHLVPKAFACVKCQQAITMDECVLRPAEGVSEADAPRDQMPWFHRKRVGTFRAFFRTLWMAMATPARLVRAVPVDGGGQRWTYALITLAAILLCGGTLPLSGIGLIAALSGSSDGVEMMLVGLYILGGGLVFFLAVILLWGLVTHTVLVLTGGAKYPLGRTYDAFCYSVGANATSAIPCIGIYPFVIVGFCWWIVSAILMVGQAQQIRGPRAVIATLVFPGFFVLLFLASVMGLMWWGMGQARIAMAPGSGEIPSLTTAIIDYGSAHEGRGPTHMLELVASDTLSPFEFTTMVTPTTPADIPVADTTLEAFTTMTDPEVDATLEAVMAKVPDDVVAHRFGDFVFTYHGLDLRIADPARWIVIASPDPVLSSTSSQFMFTVGKVDGSIETIERSTFTGRLDEENEARAVLGLKSIPMPARVLQDQPWRAGDT